MSRKIGLRFDGSNEIGMGHIYRCLSIIEELKSRNIECIIFTKKYDETVNLLRETSNKVYYLNIESSFEDEVKDINAICSKENVYTFIIDRLNTEPEYIKSIKNTVNKVITFDDCGHGSRYADVVINGILDTPFKNDIKTLYAGNQYIVLKNDFLFYSQKHKKINSKVEKVLLTFGGSDPKDITLTSLKELSDIQGIEITVVIGPGFNKEDRIYELSKSITSCKVIKNATNMAQLIYESDLCIVSGGITLFEVASIGTPAIVVCQVDHQVVTANKFEIDGVCINLGLIDKMEHGKIYSTFKLIDSDVMLRKMISEKGKESVDGLGIKRVSEIIINEFLEIT